MSSMVSTRAVDDVDDGFDTDTALDDLHSRYM